MRWLSEFVDRHKKSIIIITFVAVSLVGVLLFLLTPVNYNMMDYLPEDANSTKALNLMQEEFDQPLPNLNVMVENVSLTQALDIKERIASADYVKEVLWLDDNILKNLVYTGTLVSHKMKSCGVGSRRQVPNEPIIVEGTHEAIVSKEDFELAQKVIRGGERNPTRKQHDYPLKGLVRCGNCKRVMTRRKNKAGIRYFQCIHSVNNTFQKTIKALSPSEKYRKNNRAVADGFRTALRSGV